MIFIFWLLYIANIFSIFYLSILLFSYLFIKQKRYPFINTQKVFKLAVLIPAHDEKLYIEKCLNSLQRAYKGDNLVKFYVIADNCTDNTADLASKCGADVIERKNPKKKGKGYALEYAFDKLKDFDYDLYLIVDADSVVEENYFLSIFDGYRKGFEVMQGGYFVKNRVNNKNKLMNLALLVFHGIRPYAREKLGASVGLFGNGFAVSKKVITEIPYKAYSIVEDVEYHLKLIDKNKKVHYIKEAKLYADFPISKEGASTQRARWEGGRLLIIKTYLPKLIIKFLKGRVNFIEPILELITLPMAYIVLILLLLLLSGSPFFMMFSVYGFLLIGVYVIVAVKKFGDRSDFISLIGVPSYVFWKIIKLPLIFKNSKKNTNWKRTKRD